MQPIFPRPKVPSAGEAHCPRLLRATRSLERRPRWPTGAVAARFHRWFEKLRKRRLDPWTHRCRGRFRGPHALLRLLQMNTSTSTTTDRSNIPDHRIRGWDDCRSIGRLPFNRGRPPGVRRARGRELPNLDIPHRDCSRRRLRPNPDRSGHLLSRTPLFALSGETRGESGIAAVALACTARATRGSCDARLPRRSPTSTNPRCLPSSSRPGGRRRGLVRRKPH
jgi:hypothetical protein